MGTAGLTRQKNVARVDPDRRKGKGRDGTEEEKRLCSEA